MRTPMKIAGIAIVAGCVTAATAAYAQWFGKSEPKGIPLQQVADMLFTVMEADRATYTARVVTRLALEEKVIKADEHFMDKKALPLPAQMTSSPGVPTRTSSPSVPMIVAGNPWQDGGACAAATVPRAIHAAPTTAIDNLFIFISTLLWRSGLCHLSGIVRLESRQSFSILA